MIPGLNGSSVQTRSCSAHGLTYRTPQAAGLVDSRQEAAHLLHDAASKACPCLLYDWGAHKLAPGVRLGGARRDAQGGCWGGGRRLAAPGHGGCPCRPGRLGSPLALKRRQEEPYGDHGQQRERQIAYQRSACLWRQGTGGVEMNDSMLKSRSSFVCRRGTGAPAQAGGRLAAGGWHSSGGSIRSCKQQAARYLAASIPASPSLVSRPASATVARSACSKAPSPPRAPHCPCSIEQA